MTRTAVTVNISDDDLDLLQLSLPLCMDVVDEDDNQIAQFYIESGIIYLDLLNGVRFGIQLEGERLAAHHLDTLLNRISMKVI